MYYDQLASVETFTPTMFTLYLLNEELRKNFSKGYLTIKMRQTEVTERISCM
jgi:hypothetical protein